MTRLLVYSLMLVLTIFSASAQQNDGQPRAVVTEVVPIEYILGEDGDESQFLFTMNCTLYNLKDQSVPFAFVLMDSKGNFLKDKNDKYIMVCKRFRITKDPMNCAIPLSIPYSYLPDGDHLHFKPYIYHPDGIQVLAKGELITYTRDKLAAMIKDCMKSTLIDVFKNALSTAKGSGKRSGGGIFSDDEKKCSRCGGSGRCHRCGGSGHDPHFSGECCGCSGLGECINCSGTGYVH